MRVRILEKAKLNLLSSFVNLFPDVFKYLKETEVFEIEVEGKTNYLKFPSNIIKGIGVVDNRTIVLGPEEIIILECKMEEDYIKKVEGFLE
jgi:hypothetical protein